jgi:hypothetical protein
MVGVSPAGDIGDVEDGFGHGGFHCNVLGVEDAERRLYGGFTRNLAVTAGRILQAGASTATGGPTNLQKIPFEARKTLLSPQSRIILKVHGGASHPTKDYMSFR